MKERKRYLPLLLCLLAQLVAGSGCSISESDYDGGTGATTWELCDHLWEANYSLEDGTFVNHQIIFYPGGMGDESLLYNYYGEVWEETYSFYWRWANNLQNSIALSYPDEQPNPFVGRCRCESHAECSGRLYVSG